MKKNRGQSMIEYIVVTSAIMLILIKPSLSDTVFTREEPKFQVVQGGWGVISSLSSGVPAQNSFEDVIHDKQRGYSYALSLSTIPETDDLVELADYYDSLGKFPDLSNELRSGGTAINSVANSYSRISNLLESFQLPTLPNMSNVNPF